MLIIQAKYCIGTTIQVTGVVACDALEVLHKANDILVAEHARA